MRTFDRGRLACPVGSEQPEYLSLLDFEGDILDRNKRSVGLAKALNGNDGRHTRKLVRQPATIDRAYHREADRGQRGSRVTTMEFQADDLLPAPEIDFAILADGVHASSGKIYVLGGGWDTIFVQQFPARHHTLGLGLRIRVPWTRTDQELKLSVDLVDEDGQSLFGERRPVQNFRVARPPGLPDGSDVGFVRTMTFNGLVFPKPGGYAFRVMIDGDERERVRFRVLARTPG